MKNIKLITFILIIALGLGGIGVYLVYKKNTVKLTEIPKYGTTVKYEDGKLTKSILNDDYKNNFFPDLKIPVEGTSFEVIENDRNQEDLVNFMTTLKKENLNLNLTMFSDNTGRTAGVICFEDGDYQDIGNGWSREKMKSQKGSQLGYYYVKNPNYIKPDEDKFNFMYRKYEQFKKDNNQEVLPKEKIISCDYVQRVNETKTSLKQKSNSDQVFIRFMVDSIPQVEEIDQLDKIISKTKI